MDLYAIGDAAMRGVVLLIFAWLMVLVIRALRWLWRRITGVTISSVAETTGVVAGKANGAARRFASGFKAGFKKAQD